MLLSGDRVFAVRGMVFACALGVMVLWPAFRLSQDMGVGRRGGSGGLYRVLLDWWSVVLLLQAVLWPLRMAGGWGVWQTVYLSGAIAGWGLLVGIIVAVGCRSRVGFHRVLAMMCCVLLLLGEPVFMGLLNWGVPRGTGVVWAMRVSPIQTLWWLSSPPASGGFTGLGLTQVLGVFLVAVIGWCVMGAFEYYAHHD